MIIKTSDYINVKPMLKHLLSTLNEPDMGRLVVRVSLATYVPLIIVLLAYEELNGITESSTLYKNNLIQFYKYDIID